MTKYRLLLDTNEIAYTETDGGKVVVLAQASSMAAGLELIADLNGNRLGDLTEAETAVVGDALNLHRHRLETGGYVSHRDWLAVQDAVEEKFVRAGLPCHLDGQRLGPLQPKER